MAQDSTGHAQSLSRTAASATLHCLTGCAVGEVLGMVVTTALTWGTLSSVVLSIVLAFFFGYSFSLRPLVKSLGWKQSFKIALAADTASITTMEAADNLVILVIPGAIHATLGTLLFWGSLVFSLAVAFLVAFPLNRYLIARGKGHALAHAYHH
jgi:hypothetical protein